jgi:hypothetical protein
VDSLHRLHTKDNRRIGAAARHRTQITGSPAPSLVTVPTKLYQLFSKEIQCDLDYPCKNNPAYVLSVQG